MGIEPISSEATRDPRLRRWSCARKFTTGYPWISKSETRASTNARGWDRIRAGVNRIRSERPAAFHRSICKRRTNYVRDAGQDPKDAGTCPRSKGPAFQLDREVRTNPEMESAGKVRSRERFLLQIGLAALERFYWLGSKRQNLALAAYPAGFSATGEPQDPAQDGRLVVEQPADRGLKDRSCRIQAVPGAIPSGPLEAIEGQQMGVAGCELRSGEDLGARGNLAHSTSLPSVATGLKKLKRAGTEGRNATTANYCQIGLMSRARFDITGPSLT
jgi:hypothetical protein